MNKTYLDDVDIDLTEQPVEEPVVEEPQGFDRAAFLAEVMKGYPGGPTP